MKPTDNFRLVLVTCANHIQAKLIARSVVEKRLAACVNILRSPIESHYRWQGKVEKARELLLIIKTTARKLSGLEREVKRLILCLTHWVEASGGMFWPSKPHEHWCCRHHKGNRFNFKKEIRA